MIHALAFLFVMCSRRLGLQWRLSRQISNTRQEMKLVRRIDRCYPISFFEHTYAWSEPLYNIICLDTISIKLDWHPECSRWLLVWSDYHFIISTRYWTYDTNFFHIEVVEKINWFAVRSRNAPTPRHFKLSAPLRRKSTAAPTKKFYTLQKKEKFSIGEGKV